MHTSRVRPRLEATRLRFGALIRSRTGSSAQLRRAAMQRLATERNPHVALRTVRSSVVDEDVALLSVLPASLRCSRSCAETTPCRRTRLSRSAPRCGTRRRARPQVRHGVAAHEAADLTHGNASDARAAAARRAGHRAARPRLLCRVQHVRAAGAIRGAGANGGGGARRHATVSARSRKQAVELAGGSGTFMQRQHFLDAFRRATRNADAALAVAWDGRYTACCWLRISPRSRSRWQARRRLSRRRTWRIAGSRSAAPRPRRRAFAASKLHEHCPLRAHGTARHRACSRCDPAPTPPQHGEQPRARAAAAQGR